TVGSDRGPSRLVTGDIARPGRGPAAPTKTRLPSRSAALARGSSRRAERLTLASRYTAIATPAATNGTTTGTRTAFINMVPKRAAKHGPRISKRQRSYSRAQRRTLACRRRRCRLEQAGNGAGDFPRADGFHQVQLEAGRGTQLRVGFARIASEGDGAQLGAVIAARADLTHQRQAVLLGQPQVTHQDIVRRRLQPIQRGRGGLHRIDMSAPVLERVTHELEDVGVVVDHQDAPARQA